VWRQTEVGVRGETGKLLEAFGGLVKALLHATDRADLTATFCRCLQTAGGFRTVGFRPWGEGLQAPTLRHDGTVQELRLPVTVGRHTAQHLASGPV